MIKNAFKIAFRNFVNDKLFSALNLIGLATGLACTLLIYLWVADEINVDRFNSNDARLYQVLKKNKDDEGTIRVDETTQGMLAQSIAKELPEVEFATKVKEEKDPAILSFDNKSIKTSLQFAGEDFFNIFSYPLIHGNKKQVLADASNIILSDKSALKLFNTTQIVGKTVSLHFKEEDIDFSNVYTIAGVFKSPPVNASRQFDVILPFDLYAKKNAGKDGDVTFWGSNMVLTYVVLKPGTNAKAFNSKLKDFSKNKISSLSNGKELLKYEGELMTQKYSDRYLCNNYVNGVQSGGRIAYVRLFSLIAVFILVIACTNFMNLSTAKASRRMKEVGIKKVIGASRTSLIVQYMAESMFMSLVSLVTAIGIVVLMLPAFKEITGKEIIFRFNADFIAAITCITIITGLIAGSYPAIYLSGFKPTSILKGKWHTSVAGSWIRKSLVVFQFSISVILIVAVVVVYQQMKLVKTTNLGYNKDNIIRFSSDGNLPGKLSSFISALKSIPGVINASNVNGDLMGHHSHAGGGISWEGKDPGLGIEYYGNSIGHNYFETMGLQVAEGRAFSKSFSDSSSVIFNQSAVKAMGLKNPVGKTVFLWGEQKQIVGVVKDYHFQSLYKKIGPAFFTYSAVNPTIVVKIKTGAEQQTIGRIKELYKKYNSGLDFNYAFLNDDYDKLYQSEQRVAMLSKYFATITIIISCLGLFGLTAFTAQKRQKEIGIRRVIGASVSGITGMLSRDFIQLVGISLLISFPLSWWLMHNWLQGFAYHIALHPSVFLITGFFVLVIAVVTVSFQAVKAAIANPVKSLRSE